MGWAKQGMCKAAQQRITLLNATCNSIGTQRQALCCFEHAACAAWHLLSGPIVLLQSHAMYAQATYYCGNRTDAGSADANQCGFQPTLACADGQQHEPLDMFNPKHALWMELFD
jgi:hypothetical protein